MQTPESPKKKSELDQSEVFEFDFSDVLKNSLHEIYISDEKTLKFIQVNKGARHNLGYSMDELLTMTLVDIKPNHTNESFLKLIKPLTNGDLEKVVFNTVHRRKDGSDYFVELHIQKMLINSQSVLVAVIIDMTERMKNKLELDQALAFLDSAPDATVVVDEAGIIQVSNQQMTKLLGFSHKELIGMNVDLLVPKPYRSRHASHRTEFSAHAKIRGMGAGLDLSAVAKDGSEIPIEVSLSPIKTSDGNLVVAAIRDISYRKGIEEELQSAKQEAEEATIAKTRFLATASHDLRQPLQALRLYLSALTTKLDEPKAKQLGEKMNLSLDTMGELLDALLDISTLESGSVTVDKRDVKLSEVFDRVITDNAQQAKEKDLKLGYQQVDCFVYTDPALFQRIIDNFITNAIRYTEKGEITLKAEVTDNMVVIKVCDTGTGIPEKDFEGVFDEFVQLDNAVRTTSKGLGLGLSIVKHIARILEHPINVTSVVGEGSCFSVEVNLGESQAEKKTPDEVILSSVDRSNEPTVLIVDNEPAIVDAMFELLSMYDMKVVTAGHGAEALAYIQEGLEPDFVLTDYRMPEINGVELIKKIRAAYSQDVAVAIMTGDTAKDKIIDADLENCTLLQKPVKIDVLLSLIHSSKT